MRSFLFGLGLLLAGAALAATLGEPFELAVGESSAVEEVTVTFVAVDGDSRCPVDVNCIVAGQATVVLSFASAGAEAVEERVDVPPGGEASVSFGDLSFQVGLEPEARSDESADEREYRAVLTASR